MAKLIQKKWTFMVYLAGDNNLADAGTADLREMKKVGTTDQINVVAQFDRGTDHETRRYLLSKGNDLAKDMVQSLGKTNTGDPEILESFIEWGIEKYPAEHYMVVVWNHGNGWDDEDVYRTAKQGMKLAIQRRGTKIEQGGKGTIAIDHLRAISTGRFRRALFQTTIRQAIKLRGIAYDDNARDFLDNIELKNLLAAVTKKLGGKIDILGMDACMMSMAEVLYQLKDSVLNTVASEETEPGDGWPYDTLLSSLAANPNMTAGVLAKTVVEKYLASYDVRSGVTQSACDLSKITDISGAIDRLAKALIQNLSDPSLLTQILYSRTQVQSYHTADYIDLYDFCELLAGRASLPAVKTSCHDVLDVLQVPGFVIYSGSKGASVQHSHGVSIYFPRGKISSLYGTLDFNKERAWQEFLTKYGEQTARR